MSDGDAAPRWRLLLRTELAWVLVAVLFAVALFLFFPENVANLQLAGDPDTAASVVQDWEDAGSVGVMRLQTLLDFPFVVLYAAALWRTVRWAAHTTPCRSGRSA